MPTITYREALNQALREEMRRDPDVFLMGEDIGVFEGAYKVTTGLLAEFGEKRVRDTPIAELGIVGLGVGAAMLGLRPVVELMTVNFALMAMDQIVNHAAKIHYMFGGQARVPIVLRMPEGGGFQLAATHSQTFDSWFGYVPGLRVVTPSVPSDAKGMLKAAIRSDDPVIFLESEALYNTRGEVPEGEYLTRLDTAEIRREGRDVTLIANSRMTLVALEAARRLEGEGIDAEVVDLRSIRPLDRETLVQSLRKTNRAVTVEEGWRTFGVGAEIAASLSEMAFDYLDAPILRVAGLEVPMPYSKNLEKEVIPDADDVIAQVRKLFNK